MTSGLRCAPARRAGEGRQRQRQPPGAPACPAKELIAVVSQPSQNSPTPVTVVMENPGRPPPSCAPPRTAADRAGAEQDIPKVIHLLTQTPPHAQHDAVEKYFTPNASFTHPFCRTGKFSNSRLLILAIYRWYKIMSPRIDLRVNSVGKKTRPAMRPRACSGARR